VAADLASPRTCLLTPVYSRDVDRFKFLRESIEACGVDLPHIAVVHTEDVHLLKSLAHRKRLTILTTADVLPAWFERKRRAWGRPRWSVQRIAAGWPMDGWTAQMFTKLSAPSFCDADTVVCIDADMAFVREVAASDFHVDGKPQLYRFTESLDVEMVEWVGRSLRFLGVNPCGKEPRKYTYSPLPMSVSVLKDLQTFIERRAGTNWLKAMLREMWVTEYATYGAFAEHVDQLQRVVPVTPRIAGWCWWPAEAQDLHASLKHVCNDPLVKVVGVQSNLRREVTSYADAIRSFW
jgi:hypothetical protein